MEHLVRSQSTRVRVAADADGVADVRRTITQQARDLGADEPTVRRVALAVSEAATNAVLHAYPGDPGTVEASISGEDGQLEVVVADDGQGLQSRSDSPGLGMGLGIIAEVTERLAIDARPGRGTRVLMWFPVRTGEPPRSAG